MKDSVAEVREPFSVHDRLVQHVAIINDPSLTPEQKAQRTMELKARWDRQLKHPEGLEALALPQVDTRYDVGDESDDVASCCWML